MKKNQKPYLPAFTIGELNIVLKIDFKDEDLEIKSEEKTENNQEKKYYDLDELTDLKSLSFLHKNEGILKKFQFQSKNNVTRMILIGSENMQKQTLIDYVCYNIPYFENDEKFFNDVLDYITARNGIIFNKTPLNTNAKYSIRIEMTHKEKSQVIILGSDGVEEHEEDNEIKAEGASDPYEDEYDENKEEEADIEDYEETPAMKKKLIPRFRRKNVLCNLYPQYTKYGMIFFNYDELKKIQGKFSLSDLFELCQFFKKKNSSIFVNFYEPEDYEEEEKNKKKKKKRKKQKKEKDNNDDEPSDEMKSLNELYYITDIYFFDKKQAIKMFDAHYRAFTADDPKKPINSRNVFDYFIKGIATGTGTEVPYEKTGIFLDEFNKFVIIKVSKKEVNKKELDCQPFPKINTHNLDEVSEYKDIIKYNKNDYYLCFLSNMVTSMGAAAPKCIRSDVIYPSYLTGIDIVKKKIEFTKNKLKVPDDEENFYKIKRHPKDLAEKLEKLSKGEREGKFLLDCTNLITSNKKEYVSLYDYHLKNFFSSQIIRDNLKKKGFIDSEGYIMYDPVFRNVMGTRYNNKKKYTDKEMHDTILNNIRDIKLSTKLYDKNIISEKNAFNEKVATQNKIPYVKEKPIIIKKRRKKNKEGEGGSNSSSSDEENKDISGEKIEEKKEENANQ